MKRLSFIFLAAAMLLGATGSFAQDRKQAKKVKLFSNEEFFSKSDYIIQAIVVEMDTNNISYDAGGNYDPNDIYSSLLLIVGYVYKNSNIRSISPGDTLNYIRKGGSILQPMSKDQPWGAMLITYPPQLDFYPPQPDFYAEDPVSITKDYGSAIYFMKISDLPENPEASYRDKYPKVTMLQNVKRASIRISYNAYGLNDLQFNNRYELYKYMEQFEGVTVPLSNPDQMRIYLRHHEGVFEQYLKERNVKWVDPHIPRPATQPCIFTVNSNDSVTVKFYSTIGKEVLSQAVSGQTEIDLSRYLPTGVYIAIISSGDKTIEKRKVTVQ